MDGRSTGGLVGGMSRRRFLGGLPLLIVFLFFQRQIVQGIANTGLKD